LRHADFCKAVFNPDVGRVSDKAVVVITDSLLQSPDITEVRPSGGGHTIIFPVFSGGWKGLGNEKFRRGSPMEVLLERIGAK
jgi:hypothetical protein